MTNGAPAAAETVELYLLRHADAGDPMTWAGDDAERPLSGKGRRQAKRLGSLLAGIKLRPDVILTSPMLRAADTAKIVGKAVSVKPKKDDRLAVSISSAIWPACSPGTRMRAVSCSWAMTRTSAPSPRP